MTQPEIETNQIATALEDFDRGFNGIKRDIQQTLRGLIILSDIAQTPAGGGIFGYVSGEVKTDPKLRSDFTDALMDFLDRAKQTQSVFDIHRFLNTGNRLGLTEDNPEFYTAFVRAREVIEPTLFVHIPESSEEFNQEFPVVYIKDIAHSSSPIEEVEMQYGSKVDLQTFTAQGQPLSVLAVYESREDAVGIAAAPNGTINLVVADGVGNNGIALVASRMAVRGSLNQLAQGTLSEDTLRAAYNAIQSAPVEKIFADEMQRIRGANSGDPDNQQLAEGYIRNKEKLVESGKLASTTLVAAQYDRQQAKLRIGVRGDSSVVVFRQDGTILTFLNPSDAGNLTYALSYTPAAKREAFKPYNNDIYQEIDLENDDVVMLCTDGISERSGAYQKIQAHLMKLRTLTLNDRLDQVVVNYIRANLDKCIRGDDVSVVALHHQLNQPADLLRPPGPQATPAPVPTGGRSSLSNVRGAIPEDDNQPKGLADKVKKQLKESRNYEESTPLTVAEVIDYLKTVKLGYGTTIKEAHAQFRDGGLVTTGVVGVPKGEATFSVVLENGPGGIVAGEPNVNLPWHLQILKGKVMDRIRNINVIVSNHINKEIGPEWKVSQIRLTNSGVILETRMTVGV